MTKKEIEEDIDRIIGWLFNKIPLPKDQARAMLIAIVRQVALEVIGENESERGDKSRSPVYDILCRNQLRQSQRELLDKLY